jgi:queuine tRNA-ribosyltransferase
LTPESSVQAQKDLGADIIIPFDELPPYHINENKLEESLHRTHRWEKRSLDVHLSNPQQQAMYAVIHGGINKALRKESCDYLTSLPFDGFAIGGSLGKITKKCLTC